ncbi:L-serine ammonia-lyase [Corynebacterium kozikiae]|uniref:L-serine ammonia-lyase n=1 Tax=Corynebacterium kozikiae TaxID=2968469 RepID=UPI00211C0D61|nr:L-serine ammonia-lyase [Corynebacterium sp. 76QC2CO]MCQ9342521.1 L-serine ammonia-lyase [Corynebacterium sp. 76QC2CO]
MTISVCDLFSIGIGPSSSHTVGPMRAANNLVERFPEALRSTVEITLHGSLAATGVGHGSDRAAILGLAGYTPTTCDSTTAPAFGEAIAPTGAVTGPNGTVNYRLHFDTTALPEHPNAITFAGPNGVWEVYYSVGGGFVQDSTTIGQRSSSASSASAASQASQEAALPYPFHTGAELLAHCTRTGLTIPEVMLANETAIHGDTNKVFAHLDAVWHTMQQCVARGMKTEGILPGGLGVRRRAMGIYTALVERETKSTDDPLRAMEWLNLYAMAVNEENAAGGTVVTAPTNGAAGIIPAVLHFAKKFRPEYTHTTHRDFLLAAGAVGLIIKENASISGAEVGCQGEVGSASAMAAAGICQVTGGTPHQVEHAAEVALEHNLGLTCDPVGGLVQIPCIERNAIGAVKSINASRLSKHSTGTHLVSLDDVVKTMADTGRDMLTKYKETSTGGLAVNLGFPVSITEC